VPMNVPKWLKKPRRIFRTSKDLCRALLGKAEDLLTVVCEYGERRKGGVGVMDKGQIYTHGNFFRKALVPIEPQQDLASSKFSRPLVVQ
jgi:hypothetical protein